MLLITLNQTGELIARKSFYDSYQLLLLFLGVAFLGMARLSNSKTISSAFGTLLNFKTEVAFNDSIKIHPLGSFFLILNFLFSGSLLVFLATLPIFDNDIAHYLFSFGLAIVVLLIYLIGFYLVGFLTSYSTKLPI
jgi:drug/metabolite transporter (DMT)-like permease